MSLWQGPWGAKAVQELEDDIPQGFACGQCGAVLAFEPGTEELSCSYCGHTNRIEAAPVSVGEHDLLAALGSYAKDQPQQVSLTRNCDSCAGEFTLPANDHAGLCPYCSTPLVLPPGDHRSIAPEGILPFVIGDAEARRLMSNWLKRLWFAPSKLKDHAGSPDSLHGRYLPFFTFDSQTETRYRGQRGDIYYETVRVRQTVKGKSRMVTQKVPKIRWHPVSGHVSRFFDDVLVPASNREERPLLDKIDHWDLISIKPYQDSYLSGFESGLYSRELAEGRADAEETIRNHIRFEIKRQIGGDQQRINSMDVQHSNQSYKLILLPIWQTVFSFMGKTYPVLINGRTGEVAGRRPYSPWKIAAAVLLALVVLGALAAVGAVAR